MSGDEEEGRMAASVNVSWDLRGQRGVDDAVDDALRCALASRDRWTQMASAWVAITNDRTDLLDSLPDAVDGPVAEMMSQWTNGRTRGSDMERDQPLTSMEKITFLKASPFFTALPLEELYHIALSVQEESAKAGKTVIRQGTLGDKMYIVVEGELEVRRFDNEEEASGVDVTGGHLMATMRDKQVFGDMALLDDEPRSASVIAVQDCALLSLQRGDLERILRRYSSIAFNMMRILSGRLRESMAA